MNPTSQPGHASPVSPNRAAVRAIVGLGAVAIACGVLALRPAERASRPPAAGTARLESGGDVRAPQPRAALRDADVAAALQETTAGGEQIFNAPAVDARRHARPGPDVRGSALAQLRR
jgi:hypothetical protein